MKMTESQKLECKIKREFFMEIVQTFNSNDKAAIINKLDQIREKKENGDKFSITNVVLTKILSNPDLNKNLFFELIYLTGTKYTCEYTKRYPSGILSKMRYYDIDSRDYKELLDTLALDRFSNTEISTLKFFNDFPELMNKYDIRDQYELHNLLKKICNKENYSKISA